MKHILIVEPDESFAARLYQALAADRFQVSAVPGSREATLIVAQQPQDLAFIPYEAGVSLLHALRRHQPDLRVVLLVPQADVSFPPAVGASVQEVLPRSAAVREAPAVVDRVLKQTVQVTGMPEELEPLETGALQATLNGLTLDERIFSVLLTRNGDLLGNSGTLGEKQAQAVAVRLQESWEAELSSQLQFIRLPSRTSDLLLFTRAAADNHLLTIVSRPDLPMGLVRRQMDKVLEQVGEMVAGLPPAAPAEKVVSRGEAPQNGPPSYAIVWGPRQPLPDMLLIPLRRSLERIADSHGCQLSHLKLTAEMVHIVVTTPAGRGSAWAAHLLKRGAEREIQKQFGIETSLWDRGYYATDSTDPLTEIELDLFPARNR